MFHKAAPGLHFFTSGQAWEKAFRGAVDFLDQNAGMVLLGPGAGECARHWIRDERKEALSLGARVQDWQEWIQSRARSLVLAEGSGFRVFNDAARREFFRALLSALEESGSLLHLQNMWREERFFTALLQCVEEARFAGLHENSAVMRARELLASDGITRDSYDDFWKLLLLFENQLNLEAGLYDRPALVRRATAFTEGEADLYLLGFDHLSLLETDLLQLVARNRAIFLPLGLSQEEMEAVRRGLDAAAEQPAALLARGLLTNFPGAVTVHKTSGVDQVSAPSLYLLAAHAPSEEARSAAAFGQFALQAESENNSVVKTELRFVLDRKLLDEESVVTAFREELQLPRRFHELRLLAQPVARLFFHALELKDRQYELNHGIELAQLLQFSRGKFFKLPALANAAGVRKGLRDWQAKAAEFPDPELVEFVALLEEIDRLLPEKGSAAHFAGAAEGMAKLSGIGELARRAVTGEIEREVHNSLAGLLRNTQLLAASVKGELTFSEWMREWKALLQRTPAGGSLDFFPRIQFYGYGEWLPPGSEGTITMVLGFQRGVEPKRGFQFYLEEGARRKLSDLLLSSQTKEDLCFVDQIKRIARSGGDIFFSWSRLDSTGKEQRPSWISSLLQLKPGDWPELARPLLESSFRAISEVRTSPPHLKGFSASLLEVYQECPFKAFALKILHLEDKMQAASLDLGHLEQGNIVHRTLELFYGERKGKGIHDTEEREKVLAECLASAMASQKVEYFKGGAGLLAFQLKRLHKILLRFLEIDAANYAAFPFFSDPLVERKVSGSLGADLPWSGKIDRVDLDTVNKRFLVLDYKSGATTPKSGEIKSKEAEGIRRFQLQLYMDAMEAELPGWTAIGGLYASLRTGERKQGMIKKEFNRSAKTPPGATAYFQLHARTGALTADEDFQQARERTRAEATRVAGRIREGMFDVVPLEEDSCKRCEVRPACRIRELQAPARLPWNMRIPRQEFAALLREKVLPAKEQSGKSKGFNSEQTDALGRRNALVFIEASAGTGKTTVIVERIRRFLLERVGEGEAAHRAVEKFAAISFTDKSAQELAARLSASLVQEPALGTSAAAQATRQVTTIHGFCRRILSDFPVEAGISPMAELLDERQAETLRENAFDEFFLHTPAEAQPGLEALFEQFPRAKVERLLRLLLERRLLLTQDISAYKAWLAGEMAAPGALVQPGEERVYIGHLLSVSEVFFASFDKMKRDRDFLDFNDLEAMALKVLGHEHARDFYRERFALLLVDEFQDTNSVQREILERLAQPGWKNVFVVGDAKQSIYRFRAADVSVFQGLRKQAEQRGELVTLSRNYRSRRELVEGANAVTRAIFPASGIAAPDFEAVAAESLPERECGGRIAIMEYGEPGHKPSAGERRAEEAALLVKLVREQLNKGRKAGEIAILFRKLSSNGAYLGALTAAGIPFRVGSSRGFYAQQVVLDAIALLRALCGACNDMALLALLRSPWIRLSDSSIMAVQKRGTAREPLWDLLRENDAPLLFEWRRLAAFLSASELLGLAFARYPLDRREHLQVVKLLAVLAKMEGEGRTRVDIIDRISLWAGWENEEDSLDDSTMPEPGSGGAVQVLTVHAAKGLEFDVTILPDLASGLQPDRAALRLVPGVGMALKLENDEENPAYDQVGGLNKERELAESKRLLYVAITRAREECILLMPRAEQKADSWAGMLRKSELEGIAEKYNGPKDAEISLPEEAPSTGPMEQEFGPDPSQKMEPRLETSITEIAAYQFCPEFHRRKYVQQWDDRVVALWPKPEFRKKSGESASRGQKNGKSEAAPLLRALGLENKERGIALHRVLERVKTFDPVLGRLWLAEAYEAQGADVESPHFSALVDIDLALLARFLRSPMGRELFSPEVEAFPELAFQWRIAGAHLQGAIDRVIRRPDGSWVVVDYKSSILEDSRERYHFQVASYMAAVAAHARLKSKDAPKVEGYLLDLFEATAYPVTVDPLQSTMVLEEEITKVRASYTLASAKNFYSGRGLQGGEHCFSCPYSLHCDLGKQIVLAFP